jgi:hypothetical protein
MVEQSLEMIGREAKRPVVEGHLEMSELLPSADSDSNGER